MSSTINVINATNLTTSVELDGVTDLDYDPEGSWSPSKPRAYAFICTETEAKIKSQRKRLIEFGERLPDDFVVRLQDERSYRGRLNLDFHDSRIKIHYISVNVNVSKLWTLMA